MTSNIFGRYINNPKLTLPQAANEKEVQSSRHLWLSGEAETQVQEQLGDYRRKGFDAFYLKVHVWDILSLKKYDFESMVYLKANVKCDI